MSPEDETINLNTSTAGEDLIIDEKLMKILYMNMNIHYHVHVHKLIRYLAYKIQTIKMTHKIQTIKMK